MAFEKREGCWHWEYTGPYARSEGKKIWRFWWAAMLLGYSILGIVLLSDKSLGNDTNTVLFIVVDIGICITVPFVILWFLNRHGKQGCAYTANESVSWRPYGAKGVGFLYANIKTLTRCTDRDAIVFNMNTTDGLAGSIFANAEDYQAVWSFFVEHCPKSEITAPITGKQYDELFEITREPENGKDE